jgi:trans-2-enoyl-CoA reductase
LPPPARPPRPQVGPGVKSLAEGQLVLPLRPFLGTWRGALVARERDLLPVPQDAMPPELLAMSREMCAAYRLLEDYGRLKVHARGTECAQMCWGV